MKKVKIVGLIVLMLVLIGCKTNKTIDFNTHGNFTRIGDTVRDSSTSLEWQDADIISGFWQESMDTCETLTFNGKNDWRLPSLKELSSLFYDKTGKNLGNLKPVFFTKEPDYWSSTDASYSDLYAYYIHDNLSIKGNELKTRSQYGIRCVRTAK